MTEYIKHQMKLMENREFNCNYFVNIIQFIQHERLIHLIITIISAIFFLGFGVLFLIASNIITGILFLIFTILLIFYIKHYCFLENSVQKMYQIYENMYKEENKTE